MRATSLSQSRPENISGSNRSGFATKRVSDSSALDSESKPRSPLTLLAGLAPIRGGHNSRKTKHPYVTLDAGDLGTVIATKQLQRGLPLTRPCISRPLLSLHRLSLRPGLAARCVRKTPMGDDQSYSAPYFRRLGIHLPSVNGQTNRSNVFFLPRWRE